MRRELRAVIGRSRLAVVAWHLYDNWRVGRQMSSGPHAETVSGSSHAGVPIDQSVVYIDRVFRDYVQVGGLDAAALKDAQILEIGPGDNLGVALRFLGAGAAKVTCLDRFWSSRDDAQQTRIYRALLDSLPARERERAEAVVVFGEQTSFNSELLDSVIGLGAEEADQVLDAGSLDLIISRAVLEHVYSPMQALQTMDHLLKPGGLQLHKIDFRDHGMFSLKGHHPLTFLTIPDRIYRRMARESGKPNRHLLPFYRDALESLGYTDVQLLVTHVFGGAGELPVAKLALERGVDFDGDTDALLAAIRPKLLARYRDLSDEELRVAGVFLVARKPAA